MYDYSIKKNRNDNLTKQITTKKNMNINPSMVQTNPDGDLSLNSSKMEKDKMDSSPAPMISKQDSARRKMEK